MVVGCEDELEGDPGEWDRSSRCGGDEETVEAFEEIC